MFLVSIMVSFETHQRFEGHFSNKIRDSFSACFPVILSIFIKLQLIQRKLVFRGLQADKI